MTPNWKWTASLGMLSLTAVFDPAMAQNVANRAASPALDEAAPDKTSQAKDAIVVTGTLLDGMSTFRTPTPVTSLTLDELATSAPATLADALRLLPAVVPGGGAAAGGGLVGGGQNFLNLRGLGNPRTLVLVNGLRFVPSGPNGLVDINLIPQGIVSRVDIVTGGASAAYGSDAVAGVVNFNLDTAFKGLRINAFSGISQRGDNNEIKVEASAGFSAIDDRLSVVVSGEHYDNQGVSGTARSFRRKASAQIRNPAGTPTFIRAQDVRTPYTPGGLVVVGAGGTSANNALISGLMFTLGSGTAPYSYGTNATTRLTTNGNQDGGDGFPASTGQDIIRPLKRDAAFAHGAFRVTDNLTLEAQGVWGKSRAVFANSPNVATLTIQRANPFLAAAAPALVTQMTALAVPRFSLNRLILERGLTLTTNDNESVQALVGARLKLLGLEWRAAYQHGRNVTVTRTDNNLIPARLARAVNALANPAGSGPAGGGPVCADLLSADATVRANAAGCIAFNPFGAGTPSQAALDYVTGSSSFETRTTQRVFDAGVTGNLFALPAGDVAIAAGYQWRALKATTVADALANAGGWRVANQQDFAGAYSIGEVFGEIQVPLLKDSALARSLDINLAGRHTDYSTSGGVNTWKAGINWQVTDWLRLRGTRSSDIRAPNLEDLFASGRQGVNTINDALTNQTYAGVATKNFGNENLTPEKARTWVLGMVLQPSASLSLAVDYWSINIDNAIAVIGANQVVEQCNLSGQTSPICSFITRASGTNAVTGVRVSPFNLTQQKARGVDLESRWQVPLERLFSGHQGSLALRLLGSYTFRNHGKSPLIANPVDDAGNLIQQSAVSGSAISSIPRARATATLDYRSGLFGAVLAGRYIHGFTWDKTKVLGVDTDFNHIPAQFYLDTQFSVSPEIAGQTVEFTFNVQNLLDHKPPYSPIPGNATPLPIHAVLYDPIGRMFRIGMRTRF